MIGQKEKSEIKKEPAHKKHKREIEEFLETNGFKYEKEFRFSEFRAWRFDYAIPDRKIAIEYEGGTHGIGGHSSGSGIEKDIHKYNIAQLHGWVVYRLTGAYFTKRGKYCNYLELLFGSIEASKINLSFPIIKELSEKGLKRK